MKKNPFISLFLVLVLFSLAACNNAQSEDETEEAVVQSETSILPFLKNKKLSNDDISFLDLITKGTSESSRGELSEVTINETTFKAGQLITADDAEIINKAIAGYFESAGDDVSLTKKPEVADGSARGCGYYCYYYYWDNWCNCYQYVWYYCCL